MSTLDYRDLPEDRLATTDEEGRRLWIIPMPVQGYWKKRKTLFHIFLLAVFILTPWLRFKGSPLLLFDILNRQFIFFGKVFASHDAPLLFFILGLLGFGLIIATAMWGRIWCGWACPQTVFIEQVFRRIESWVVGSRSVQIECSKNPFVFKNFRKIVLKWILFVLTSIFLAHTFIAYFVSWEKLLEMMQRPPSQSGVVFLITLFFSALILFDFAWFREQFCIIMCPYGRLQSVLMDQNSVTVTYDHKRGEPRGKGLNKAPGAGDCVDCFKCVAVCPTGIDIRRGQQLECIGCTACIDACDEVMEKIHRPKGLIRYAALADIEKAGKRILRPRLILYLSIFAIMTAGLIYSVRTHENFYASFLRQNQRPFVLTETELMNNFKVHLKNPTLNEVEYELSLINKDLIMAPEKIQGLLLANQDRHFPFFIKQNLSNPNPNPRVQIQIRFKNNGVWQEKIHELQMVGPRQ